MANVFGILTAIVLALSAFVAFKNQAHYETVIKETRDQHSKLETSQKRLAADKKVLHDLPIERAGVEEEINTKVNEEATQKKVNDDLKAQIDTKTAKIAENKAKLDDIRAKTEKTGNLKELAAKLRATNAELLELTTSTKSTEDKLADITAQIGSTDTQIAASKGKLERFATGLSFSELKTRIRSIYPNWGFVTLASGNNAGVAANSKLNVVRDGKTIALLMVTAVESNSASANIVPDSLAADTTLMVGDQVVPADKAPKPDGSMPKPEAKPVKPPGN